MTVWPLVPLAFLSGLWIGFRWSRVMIAHVWEKDPDLVLDKLGYKALQKLSGMVETELTKRQP